jgi:hypothetical protein
MGMFPISDSLQPLVHRFVRSRLHSLSVNEKLNTCQNHTMVSSAMFFVF